jgi:hypothetical protein
MKTHSVAREIPGKVLDECQPIQRESVLEQTCISATVPSFPQPGIHQMRGPYFHLEISGRDEMRRREQS